MTEPTEKVSYWRVGVTAKAVRLLAHIGKTPREAIVSELRRMEREGIIFCPSKGSTQGRRKSLWQKVKSKFFCAS